VVVKFLMKWFIVRRGQFVNGYDVEAFVMGSIANILPARLVISRRVMF